VRRVTRSADSRNREVTTTRRGGHLRGAWAVAAASAATALAFVAPAPGRAVTTAGAAPASLAVTSAGAAPAALAALAGNGDAVLDVVMLVDESGSETNANVAAERQTAGTIAQAMLNPRSRVTVVGFGGVNNVVPGQNPVNVACQPTIASGAVNLSSLASCVNSLHRRTETQGDDTDYAAALGQAMSYFSPDTAYGRQSPRGAIKVILMMTDGGVDVHRDTRQYGANWLAGVHHAVNLQLAGARADGVQVWPLGFGTISSSDQNYLNYLAANGAQTACDNRQVSRPRATVVQNAANALTALDALYASAGCLGSNSTSTTISGNQTRWLQVSIPPIASDAVISVDRGNPGIQVGFYLPNGQQWTGSSALSGTTSAVEALHVTSPQPGTWRIKLTAPPGLASQLVTATAFWQGAVNALMTATPSSAQPGQPISVTLSVLGANGPITDPATLSQMQVAVSVSGDGLSGPTEIPVSNAGETSGTSTGVGDYKGTFTAPQGHGTLTFTGTAAGYGLYATEVPASVQIGTGPPPFRSTIQFPVVSSVQQGQTIQGQVLFANTGPARAARLELSAQHAYATLTNPSGAIRVAPGSPPGTPFTITIAKNSPLGPALLLVQVVSAANPHTVYSTSTLEVTVTSPPSFWDKYHWYIIGAVILLLLLLLLALRRRRARQKANDVRGLYAIIRRNGEKVGTELKAPNKQADTFRFVIRDEGEQGERLDYPRPEDTAYTARRGRIGEVKVRTPAGEEYDIAVGGSGEPLPSGLRLAFSDAKYTGRASRAGANGDRSRTNGGRATVPTPAPPVATGREDSPPSGPGSEKPDIWLQ
jgi:MYXO-CTERM domain-containing protein